MPTSTFDTLTGTGGPVDFSTSSSSFAITFDEIAGAATTQQFKRRTSTTFIDPVLTVEMWNAANTSLVSSLASSFDRGFQDELSSTGSGNCSVLASDPDAFTAGVLRYKLDDTYAFAARVERTEITYVSEGEEANQIVSFNGRGLVSEFEDAIVYPLGGTAARPISDERAFSWASPELSTTGWRPVTVAVAGVAIQDTLDPPLHAPWFPPAGWPADLTPSWIWSRGQGVTSMPDGASLFRSSFTMPADGRASLFYTADSRCRIWVDGILLEDWTSQPNERSFLFTHRATPYLTAGTHYVAIEAESRPWLETISGVSRGIVLAAGYTGGVGGTFNTSTRLFKTDSTWKCLDYPAVYPAPTPGKILSTLLAEAQARGALTGWSLGCSNTADSAGRPWPVDAAYTFRIGQSYLDVLRQMADVSIDFSARPVGKVLDVYIKDTVLVATGETFSAGVNLTELQETVIT